MWSDADGSGFTQDSGVETVVEDEELATQDGISHREISY